MSSLLRRRIVFILGMHRSGTSLTAELVSELGFSVPGNMLAAVDDVNAHGFWESQQVVDFNERLLVGARLKWFHVCPVGHLLESISPDVVAEISADIQQFVHAEVNRAGNLVIKDPRLCITLPVWLSALTGEEYDIQLIYINRHPAAVADSLRARDGFSLFSGHLLWLYYFFSIFDRGYCKDVLYLDYEKLLEDRSCGECLSQFLGVEALDASAWNRIVDPGLQRRFEFDFPDNGFVYNLAKRAHSIFAHGSVLDGSGSVSELAANFEQFVFENNDFVYALNESNSHLAMTRAQMISIGDMHTEALEVIRDKDRQLQENVDYIALCQSRLNESQLCELELNSVRASLESALNEVCILRDGEVRNTAYIAECEGRIFDLEFSLAEFFTLRCRLSELDALIARRNSEALRNEAYISRLDARISELHEAMSEFDELRARLTDMDALLLAREQELIAATRQLAGSESRIAELEGLFSIQRANYQSAMNTVDGLERKLSSRNDEFLSVVDELALLKEKVEGLLSWRIVRMVDRHVSKGV
ncbi:MAG: hypothetical protein IT470_09415 [Pseudomonadales bacterium]|nr:hypothetical protein [Pseudomonadales bacterium]